MGKFINFTNHPSRSWDSNQLEIAHSFGDIIDLQFPNIPTSLDENDLKELAQLYLNKIREIAPASEAVVHIMGEMTFCFYMVRLLIENEYRCVASATERIVSECGSGHKEVTFKFERFRDFFM